MISDVNSIDPIPYPNLPSPPVLTTTIHNWIKHQEQRMESIFLSRIVDHEPFSMTTITCFHPPITYTFHLPRSRIRKSSMDFF